jgi:hypothetical protein
MAAIRAAWSFSAWAVRDGALSSASRRASSRVNGAATHGKASTLAASAANSDHPARKHMEFMFTIPVMIRCVLSKGAQQRHSA